jgi:hypothetical protein
LNSASGRKTVLTDGVLDLIHDTYALLQLFTQIGVYFVGGEIRNLGHTIQGFTDSLADTRNEIRNATRDLGCCGIDFEAEFGDLRTGRLDEIADLLRGWLRN